MAITNEIVKLREEEDFEDDDEDEDDDEKSGKDGSLAGHLQKINDVKNADKNDIDEDGEDNDDDDDDLDIDSDYDPLSRYSYNYW